MIFGWNFNNTEIPPGIRKKFAKRIRMSARVPGLRCDMCEGSGTIQSHPTPNRESRTFKCGKCRGKGTRSDPPVFAHLEGVGQSKEERDEMLLAADNGKRKFSVVERKTPVGIWYGIYVY